MAVIVTSKICGAKLRDGTLCAALTSAGVARCFKHGGAPRSGAPKGNNNAVKHGAYADSGECKPLRRRRDESTMRQLAQWALFNPVNATVASPAEQRRGLALAESFRRLAIHLSRKLHQPSHRTTYSTLLARRDVLDLLLTAPSCFDSEFAYQCRVAGILQTRFKARASLGVVRSIDRLDYSWAWADFCAEIFWANWREGDDEPKASSPKKARSSVACVTASDFR